MIIKQRNIDALYFQTPCNKNNNSWWYELKASSIYLKEPEKLFSRLFGIKKVCYDVNAVSTHKFTKATDLNDIAIQVGMKINLENELLIVELNQSGKPIVFGVNNELLLEDLLEERRENILFVPDLKKEQIIKSLNDNYYENGAKIYY